MDPEDMVDLDRSEIASSRADELNRRALLFILGATGGGAVGRVLAAATRARLPAAIPATRAAGSAARAAKTPPATSATSSVAAGAAKKTSPTPSAAPQAGSATSSVAAGAAKKTSPTPSAAPRAGSATSSVVAGAAKKTSPTPSAAPRAGSATPSAAARAAKKTSPTPSSAPRAGSATPSAAKTKTGPGPAAAPPAGSATPPTVASVDPLKAVNDAISKVETPVFIPSRIANTYNEIVKLLPHAGWPAYLLEKYSEKGCSDVCPFTGNGEFSPFPVQKPAVTVQKPAVAVQVPVEVDEKHHAEEDREDAEVGEKQPADGDNACFFHEMGKKASDLLYKDYTSGLKLIADCKVLDTAVLLSGGSEQIGKPSLRFEVSSDTKLIKLTIDDVLRPGLKGLLSIPISSESSSKVDLHCRHLGACITGSSELQGSPIVCLSAVIGTRNIALGAGFSLITKSLNALGAADSVETKFLRFPKYTCGLILSEGDVDASFTMENADILTATYYKKLDETTSIAAKAQRVLSLNENSLAVGFSHALDPNTTVKAKLSSDGAVSVLLRYDPKPKCYMAFSAESKTQASQKETKFGLCVALGA